MSHAFLAPSSAAVWAPEEGCRAFPALAERFPEPEDSPQSREGTAAHWVVSEELSGREVHAGDVAPNGLPIDREMIECAEGMLEDVRLVRVANPGSDMLIEEYLHAAAISAKNGGTPDAVVVNREKKTIFLWDYKYGHGYVDARENWQLLNYLIGALARFAGNAVHWGGWKGVLTVAQPRNYHSDGPLREWHVTGEEMRDHYLPRFKTSAAECLVPDPVATTGAHCIYCPARHACDALSRSAYLSLDVSQQATASELPPEALGVELRLVEDAIERLKSRKTGLEEQALGAIRSGGKVPGYAAEATSKREAWKTETAEVLALGAALGVDLLKKPEPLTPNQARKSLAKVGVDGSVIDAYSERPRGAAKLSRTKENAARLAFG